MEGAAEDKRCEMIMNSFRAIGIIILLLLVSAFIINMFISFDDASKRDKAYSLSCNPRVYVQELSVHDHNQSSTGLNSSIIIGLEFKREAAMPGTLATYSDLNMNLYDGEGPSFPVANCTVPHFRMGERRSVNYTAVMEAPRFPGGFTAVLRLELIGKFKGMDDYRFQCCCCSYEWSEVQVYAEVRVDASARMLSNNATLFT